MDGLCGARCRPRGRSPQFDKIARSDFGREQRERPRGRPKGVRRGAAQGSAVSAYRAQSLQPAIPYDSNSGVDKPGIVLPSGLRCYTNLIKRIAHISGSIMLEAGCESIMVTFDQPGSKNLENNQIKQYKTMLYNI